MQMPTMFATTLIGVKNILLLHTRNLITTRIKACTNRPNSTLPNSTPTSPFVPLPLRALTLQPRYLISSFYFQQDKVLVKGENPKPHRRTRWSSEGLQQERTAGCPVQFSHWHKWGLCRAQARLMDIGTTGGDALLTTTSCPNMLHFNILETVRPSLQIVMKFSTLGMRFMRNFKL